MPSELSMADGTEQSEDSKGLFVNDPFASISPSPAADRLGGKR